MTYHTAIIGGTMRLAGTPGEAVAEEELVTPFGRASHAAKYPGTDAIFVNRHGARGEFLAHRVNYRANMHFLKRCGVREALAVFAVGGIDRTLADGDFAIPHDLIDYTWGREHTFAPEEGVRHIEFGEPFAASVRARIRQSAARAGIAVRDGGVYGVTQGPRLETPAEIDRMERDGCTLVGMTAMPEAALARELGIAYAGVCVVVNPAAGRGEGAIDAAGIRGVIARAEAPLARLVAEFLEGGG
ncbi:MAG: S-methyl-5'-thioinosine phosphorylase [Gammaproteobacteria bacterium]|nr:S-methyl-5'-thioinosine phosphorylase [Gammaproteobacteria bacterium]